MDFQEYTGKFTAHLNSAAAENTVKTMFKKHNVLRNKYEIYRKFTFALIDTVYDTYLGQDCIYREEDIANHFKWCFNNTAKQFKDSKMKFAENTVLLDYFREYFKTNLYLSYEQRDNDLDYFDKMFNMDNEGMKHGQLAAFMNLYVLFDETHYAGRVLVRK